MRWARAVRSHDMVLVFWYRIKVNVRVNNRKENNKKKKRKTILFFIFLVKWQSRQYQGVFPRA